MPFSVDNTLDERRRETVWTYCLHCNGAHRSRMLKAAIAPRFKVRTEWCAQCQRDTAHEER